MGATMVRQNPTMAAVALALVLAGGAAGAQQFQMVSDGQDGVWVLDEGSGAVSWCRLVTAPGAKLVDVFGADVHVREAPARPGRPRCEEVRGPSATAGEPPLDVLTFFDDPGLYDYDGYLPWRERMGWRRFRGDVGVGRGRY
jgi:hypothetical protein